MNILNEAEQEQPAEPEPQFQIADECKKLLDNGWRIVIYRNQLSTYTAVASSRDSRVITDAREPSKALYRLTEKITTGMPAK